MAGTGEPSKRYKPGEVLALLAAVLGLILGVAAPLYWFFSGLSGSVQSPVSSRSPSVASPVNSPAVNPAPADVAGPSKVVPATLDPILIADSYADPLHPSRTGELNVWDLLGDNAPTSRPADLAANEESARMEKARRFVMALCIDFSSNLWVGTEEGGVQRFNPATKVWTQFTTKDGLGDDYCYALAMDRKGRIWAGHLNHGVSVYNGQKWRNYEGVGGLSRPDTLSGPLGERFFAIRVNPVDGDVWMCTSAGLARYSESKDTWTYYTREDGLPSDQANAIAFDSLGNAYLATQCDGIAIAQSADNYQRWKQIIGPDEEPTVPAGDGLPTNLINDILVAKNGTIYAATNVGLAYSKDKGESWKYVRGYDWAEKAKGRTAGIPQGWDENAGPAVLSEDYCTCLAETADGKIWVGHRRKDVEVLDRSLNRVGTLSLGIQQPHARAMLAGDVKMVGTEDNGIVRVIGANRDWALPANPGIALDAGRLELPSGAAVPTKEQLDAMIGRVKSQPANPAIAIFAGDDWRTQGDWVGRYGRKHALLCAANWPLDHEFYFTSAYYMVTGSIGPHNDGKDALRRWMQERQSDDSRVLYDPGFGYRRLTNYDDHGEAYPATFEGPDLHFTVKVTEGISRVSLYFYDYLFEGSHQARDHLIEVRKIGDSPSPSLARCRLNDFYGGVYKQFVVTGPANFDFIIHRAHSINAICSGVFVDRVNGPAQTTDGFALAGLGGVRYDPPVVSDAGADTDLWNALDRQGDTLADLGWQEKLLAFRAANAGRAPEDLLANRRWDLRLWTDSDRAGFAAAMAQGWKGVLALKEESKALRAAQGKLTDEQLKQIHEKIQALKQRVEEGKAK